MEIPQMIKLLAGNNNFNDLTIYECEVESIDIPNRNVICRATGGIDIPDIPVGLMTTIGDGSYIIPRIGSTVYVLMNPLLNPFIILYGETQSVILTSSKTITLNSDEYGGMIKIQELTDKINTLENALNKLITLYNAHVHPVSGAATGPTTSLDTDVIENTTVADIENPDILHGPHIEEG
jgi:hypothetical protein